MKENNNLNHRIKEMVGDIKDRPFMHPEYITKTETPPFRDNLQTRKPDYEAQQRKTKR